MVDYSLDLNPSSPNYLDLLVIDGDLVLTSDADPRGTNPVLQHIIQRLRTFLGEWYLDNTIGVPWFQLIFEKGTDEATIDAYLQNVICATPGVKSLTSYSFTPDTAKRTLDIKFVAKTTSGTVDYSGVLPVGGSAVNGDTG